MFGGLGVILPKTGNRLSESRLVPDYPGVVLALIIVFGYMVMDMGRYRWFKRPKYTTAPARLFRAATLLTVMGGILKWWFL